VPRRRIVTIAVNVVSERPYSGVAQLDLSSQWARIRSFVENSTGGWSFYDLP